MDSNPTNDAGIEFGDLHGRESIRRLRPDRDGQFTVLSVGKPGPAELPIFVDLDVMRDMEAHAASNPAVELGGVLLGWQASDEAGQPFVQIVDSLRAEHYEATRGSFKFTHETWTEITRRRQQLHPDLQLVGWYHTHPGWGIFLSEMDRFICDHFFAAPQDVALVIDPRQMTRGWFQWKTPGQTAQLSAWFLYAHRHRHQEIEYYSRLYAGAPMPHFDPRYAETPPAGQTTVQLIERGGSNQLHLIGWAMIGLQTLALLMFAASRWADTPPVGQQEQPAALTSSATANEQLVAAAARSDVYRDLLAKLTASDGQAIELPKLFADSQLENEQLKAASRSHVSRIAQLEQQLADEIRRVQRLDADLQLTQSQLKLAREQQAAHQLAGPSEQAVGAEWFRSGWVLPSLLGGLLVAVGALVASLLRGANLARELERAKRPLRDRPIESKPTLPPTAADLQAKE